MKTALEILKENLEAKIIACEKKIQVSPPYEKPNIYAKKLTYQNVIEEIVKLLPTDESQTEALKKEIEELKKKTEWISIEDDLPNEFTIVLVVGGDIRSCALYRDKKFYLDFPLPKNEDVTHWMPLPTPPNQ